MVSDFFSDMALRCRKSEERQSVKFLLEREVDAYLAEFLHGYMVNKENIELLLWEKPCSFFSTELYVFLKDIVSNSVRASFTDRNFLEIWSLCI